MLGAMPMTTFAVFRRQAIRTAVRIHEQLPGPSRCAHGLTLPKPAWEELGELVRKLSFADSRRWFYASRSLAHDIDYAALRLQREIEALRAGALARTRSALPLSPKDI